MHDAARIALIHDRYAAIHGAIPVSDYPKDSDAPHPERIPYAETAAAAAREITAVTL